MARAVLTTQLLSTTTIEKSESALKSQVNNIAEDAIADVGDAIGAIMLKGISGFLLPPMVAMQDAVRSSKILLRALTFATSALKPRVTISVIDATHAYIVNTKLAGVDVIIIYYSIHNISAPYSHPGQYPTIT